MKRIAATIAVALIASQAPAQEFNGAVVSLGYTSLIAGGPPSGYQTYALNGSAELGFGAMALQFDANVFGASSMVIPGYAAGIHANYALSNGLIVGGFAGYENWPTYSDTYMSYGVEAKFRASGSPLSFEGFWRQDEGISGTVYSGRAISLEIAYDVSDSLTLRVEGINFTDPLNPNLNLGIVGADYDFGNGFAVSAEATFTSEGETSLGVFFRKTFGGGTRFGPRDYQNALHGM